MESTVKEGLSEKKGIPKELPTELKRHGANQVPKKGSESVSKGGKKFRVT